MAQILPNSDDLSATWTFVEPGLQYILGTEDDQGVSAQMYMNVYTAIYNYCVNKSRSTNNSNVNSSLAASSSAHNSLLVGGEIYHKLEDYLVKYVKSLTKKPTETFLQFYVRKWKRYTLGAGYLHNVFDYMNRYWVQKERSDGRRDVHDVNTLCLLKWRDHMFENNAEKLVAEILEQIELQRRSQIINTNDVSQATRSLVSLGIDSQDSKKQNLSIYVNSFETAFLSTSRTFYGDESRDYLNSHNVVDYMKKCETRLAEEAARAETYLDEHTKKPLTEALNSVLIENHAELMYNEFITLLQQNETDHIHRMFKLLDRVPSTITPLAAKFEEYVKNEGLKNIEGLKVLMQQRDTEKRSRDDKDGKSKEDSKDRETINPREYIQVLIDIHRKFDKVVVVAFDGNPKFVKALDNACRHYINKNALATPNPRDASRTPQLLAKYSDMLLKKSSKDTDAAVDMSTDDFITIFRFIGDKDAFEVNYRKLLAKRLIHGNASSDEQEENIIARLRDENAAEYTSKMTKMFQDMQASTDLKNQFQQSAVSDSSIVGEFTPMILAETMWPFNRSKINLILPDALVPTYTKLEKLYRDKYTGRQLKWLWHLCRGELKCNLQRKGKPPFTFTVTLFQMAILLQFNEKDKFTFSELAERTGMAADYLHSHLAPLVKYKLLVKSSISNDGSNRDDETEYKIVSIYTSKKQKLNFTLGVKTEQAQEQEEIRKEIAEDRKMYLQACIVRIMKARKELRHSALINEVIQQSHSRFLAGVSDIKKAIDYLIDKEYLVREGTDGYKYLA